MPSGGALFWSWASVMQDRQTRIRYQLARPLCSWLHHCGTSSQLKQTPLYQTPGTGSTQNHVVIRSGWHGPKIKGEFSQQCLAYQRQTAAGSPFYRESLVEKNSWTKQTSVKALTDWGKHWNDLYTVGAQIYAPLLLRMRKNPHSFDYSIMPTSKYVYLKEKQAAIKVKWMQKVYTVNPSLFW